MPITYVTFLGYCRVAQDRRADVRDELFPGGLEDLRDFSVADIKEAIKGFKTQSEDEDRFT